MGKLKQGEGGNKKLNPVSTENATTVEDRITGQFIVGQKIKRNKMM